MIGEPFYEALQVPAGPVTIPLFTWLDVAELFPDPSVKVESLLNVIEHKKLEVHTALYDVRYFFRMENDSHRFTVVVVKEDFDSSAYDILAEILYRLMISLDNLPL